MELRQAILVVLTGLGWAVRAGAQAPPPGAPPFAIAESAPSAAASPAPSPAPGGPSLAPSAPATATEPETVDCAAAAPSAQAPRVDEVPPCLLGRQGCPGGCTLALHRGLFRLGQPDQVVPPPSGWTVMVPPFPPTPAQPGTKAKLTPPQPWKPLFFDNDFRYLEKPDNTYHNGADLLKRRELLSDQIVFDFGGEFRWQGRGEDNRRLTGEQNNFNLFRERLYLDTWVYDRFRMYWEVYWADASEQTVPPVFFDNDHGDVNNAFGEFRLLRNEEDKGWWSVRYGWHEELLFGNQRLVSPLDWANVRRTFDLIPHLLYRGQTWNFDLFWSRPDIILARKLNQPDYNRQFLGSYLTYKGSPNRLYDFYYLALLSSPQEKLSVNGETGDYQVHTLGTRWQGEQNNWLWEGETAYQFGQHFYKDRNTTAPRNAGMLTTGFGRRFAAAPTKPELWFYFDYASGNRNPGASDYSTFNQLFPLGHKYFGYMDIVGRQNIIDPNVFMKFYVGKRANLLFWFHDFHLASARDALYNAAGTPIRSDPTGRAGRYVGDELDIVLNFIVNPNCDWQIGLCHFWAGPFVQETAKSPARAQGGNFFYTQFTVRF